MNGKMVLFFLIGISLCCCSVKDPHNDRSAETTGGGAAALQKRMQSPAGFKQNISIIEGLIDSVVILDDSKFRVEISISSSTPEEDIYSFAEAGQRVTCTPDYFTGEGGVIDVNNSRNVKLMSLRGAKRGDSIKARISMNVKGEWKIVDIIE